jgi:hypothetical protein
MPSGPVVCGLLHLDFGVLHTGEVRRIPLLGTWVNRSLAEAPNGASCQAQAATIRRVEVRVEK